MQDIKTTYMRQRRSLFFLLSFYVLGWGFTDYKPIFLGLILGTALSLFNLWLLAKRMERFGEAVVRGERVRSLGMFSRMATAVLAVMIALKYPEMFHFYSVIFGLMTSYIVIMIDFLFTKFLLSK
ncbi:MULTISPECIES: ATP synthase subunit I [Robertmurraya]|uniref:ATP synthase subunit I n=1 Tax=Robertmurraya TaxID=2837507 RepID=UPI000BA77CF8|nr:ATP synthase subunit I [Robertmurraya siralis]PAE19632.1 ATP synthase subunit [Bacillus sp. 7504-2]